MPYASNVEVRSVGPGDFQVQITETDCGASDEVMISNVPVQGIIRRQITILGAGTGSTVDPILGRASNPSGVDVIVENATAADIVDTEGAALYFAPAGVLYHRSQPDAGTDNAVTTVYYISAGW